MIASIKHTSKAAVVVLAGGAGTRIGGHKPLRELAGRPLVDHVLSRAKNWSCDVAISVIQERQAAGIDSAVPRLLDGNTLGPIAGLASALAFARSRNLAAVLMVPCDTPFLPHDLLERLDAANAAVAIAVSGTRLHPACSLWRTTCDFDLDSYLHSGRSSLLGLAMNHDPAYVKWRLDGVDPFFNINDLVSLDMAARLWARGGLVDPNYDG